MTNNSVKIPFKVSARTAKLIGMENFSTEEGAIIELVKNTYDADSKDCVLIFDLKEKPVVDQENNLLYDENGKVLLERDKSNSKIYIIDNGDGMTSEVITNQWMTIGTSNKLYKHTTENGRIKTGAKGIGRFALNRLGLFTNMQTVSKGNQRGYEWMVDWHEFDKPSAVVSDVEAVLIEIDKLSLKNELRGKFGNFHNVMEIVNDLNFDTGTIIEISELNDTWDYEQLNRLFGNLEMLLPPREQPDFAIHLFSLENPNEFGKVNTAYYDDFDYKVIANYNKENDGKLKIKIVRNELDVDLLANKYLEVFENGAMQNAPYRLVDFVSSPITILDKRLDEVLSKNVDRNLISKIGKFDFTFYFLKNTISDDKVDGDRKKYPYKTFNSSNRKSWLKKFGGVKIFRDDFRIRPYGENGEDWLKLGARQAESPGGAGQKLGGYRIRPNQIAGTINISRLFNESFQDKSGREGLIENDVFELFKNVIIEIISFFEKDRNTIMYNLSEFYKRKNAEEEAKRKAQEEAESINDEEEANSTQNNSQSQSSYTDREKVLADGIQILTRENEEKDNEIRLLRSLASVGLIISSFAHEVKSLQSRLIPRTQFLLRELKNHIDENELSHLDIDDNPFYMIRLMQEEDTKLKHWLDYSLNTLKRDKRERTNLNFEDYFSRFKSTWFKALQQRKIDLELIGDKKNECVIRAFEVDMDSIFNNLLSNSINALYGFNKDSKKIVISWKKIDDRIEIIFSDNGKGLDSQYINNPEEIFNLNESSRKDKKGNVVGTGLGLYIVKSIIEEHNDSSISILNSQNGLSIKINFKTRK
ncbi:MAG: ATP-binding protein [Flavobacteriales bacterium]|jgi:signal transduction histidine kinase|nr:ATP-binding protein [Flavobacteriales bacterium]